MKLRISVFTLLLLAGQSGFAATVMSCVDIQWYVTNQAGVSRLVPSAYSLNIVDSSAGDRGFEGLITDGTTTITEADVEVSEALPADAGEIKDMAAVLLPKVIWSDVARVRFGNIGVAANLKNSSGYGIVELTDKAGGTLGKISQVGWQFGICN